MALKELQENVEIIQTLSTYPNQEEGLSAEALKAKFDEGVRIIKTYLNEKVVPAYNQLLQAVGDNKIEADDEIAAIGEQLNNLNVLLDGVINDKSTSVDSTWSSQKIIQVINVEMANIKENINQKINDNIDPTLSVSGKAADAKAVGDALENAASETGKANFKDEETGKQYELYVSGGKLMMRLVEE